VVVAAAAWVLADQPETQAAVEAVHLLGPVFQPPHYQPH
tara:strand:+ start:457 stop:573 length:117 start_codon:yes stop_codon:yes gene_type:complete